MVPIATCFVLMSWMAVINSYYSLPWNCPCFCMFIIGEHIIIIIINCMSEHVNVPWSRECLKLIDSIFSANWGPHRFGTHGDRGRRRLVDQWKRLNRALVSEPGNCCAVLRLIDSIHRLINCINQLIMLDGPAYHADGHTSR